MAENQETRESSQENQISANQPPAFITEVLIEDFAPVAPGVFKPFVQAYLFYFTKEFDARKKADSCILYGLTVKNEAQGIVTSKYPAHAVKRVTVIDSARAEASYR